MNIVGLLAENYVYRCILERKMFKVDYPRFAVYGEYEMDFVFFVADENGKLNKVVIEVKSGSVRNSGGALKLLKQGKLHYLINLSGNTKGGKDGNIITIPIYLFDRFKIDQIIKPYVRSDRKGIEELRELYKLK